MASAAPDWFCGLSDRDEAAAAVAALGGVRLADHPSGRPWLLGSWSAARLLTVAVRGTRVALLGTALDEGLALRAEVERAIESGTCDRLSGLAGSLHVAVSDADGWRISTDVAGLRRLFITSCLRVPVCADQARTLAGLTGMRSDDRWLAARLVCPMLPHARAHRAPFEGMKPVPPGHWLTVHGNQTVRVVRYWRVPRDSLRLGEAAERLRIALTTAVRGRVAAVSRVSVDLSGGLDSTSLGFLACQAAQATGASVCTLTLPAASASNDDVEYARRAVAAQPEAAHLFVDAGDYPLPFEDLSAVPALDEPASFAVATARVRHMAARLSDVASQLHLSGAGGDAVLLAPLSYLHAIARTRPLTALRHARGHAALHRQPASALLRHVGRPGSYRAWLRRAARRLNAAPDAPVADLGWGLLPRAAEWMTPDALAAASGILTRAAEDDPLTDEVGGHAAMERTLGVAATARLYRQALAGMGVRVEFPYLDGAVIHTCLATRAEERTDPWQAKPLLAAALTGSVPQQVLGRRTKGHYDADHHLGLARHRPEVERLLDGSLLAARGMVDVNLLRAAIDRAVAEQRGPLASLNETFACELWLRTLERQPIGLHEGRRA